MERVISAAERTSGERKNRGRETSSDDVFRGRSCRRSRDIAVIPTTQPESCAEERLQLRHGLIQMAAATTSTAVWWDFHTAAKQARIPGDTKHAHPELCRSKVLRKRPIVSKSLAVWRQRPPSRCRGIMKLACNSYDADLTFHRWWRISVFRSAVAQLQPKDDAERHITQVRTGEESETLHSKKTDGSKQLYQRQQLLLGRS